jgi:hypothetical protein
MAAQKVVKIKWPLTKVVEVAWFDANTRSRWGSLQEYMEHDVAPVLTVGYLLKDDDQQVTIITSQGADFDDINGAIAIPKDWVAKMKVLRK